MAYSTGSIRATHTNKLLAYAYIAPALLMYAAFFLWPAFHLVRLSFHEWDGLNPSRYVGFSNYQRLLNDDLFWLALKNNLLWMLGSVILPVIMGLMLAILLSRSSMHGKIFFRTIYFLPQVFSSITVAIIWGWIYEPRHGALNRFLGMIGAEGLQQGWLGDNDLVLWALFIAWSWIHYGFTMVIFIAALENIDEVFFDAAKVDGANWWQQFRHVLLPFLRAPFTTVLLVTGIFSFQVFGLVFVLTRGGPANASLVLSLHMLDNAFVYHKVGYGSAIAVALSLLILLFSVVLLKIRGTFNET